MTGSVFALLLRSLREDARRWIMPFVRALFVTLAYFLLLSAITWNFNLTAPGLPVFQSLAWLNYTLIILAGLSVFPSAIPEEKEEDTLGLLRMAGVSSVALLLGKGVSRLVTVALVLVAQAPLVLLTVTLGGVDQTQVFGTYFALLLHATGLMCLGLVAGVSCRRVGTASFLCLLAIAGSFFGPWLISNLAKAITEFMYGTENTWFTETLVALCTTVNDSSTYSRITETTRAGFSVEETYTSILTSPHTISSVVVSAILFGLAWFGLSLISFDVEPAAPQRSGLLATSGSRWKWLRMGRAWNSFAIAWKDFNLVAGGRTTLFIKLFTYSALFVLTFVFAIYMQHLSNSQIDWPDSIKIMGAATMSVATLVFCIETSLYCNRMFHQELKANTFTTLLMLPHPVPRLIAEKAAGTLLSLVPCIVMFFLGFVLISFDLSREPSPADLVEVVFTSSFLTTVVIVCFFWHLIVYLSLVLKWGALVAAIACMLLLYFLVTMFLGLVYLLFLQTGSASENGFYWFITIFLDTTFVVGIVLLQSLIVKRVHALGTK